MLSPAVGYMLKKSRVEFCLSLNMRCTCFGIWFAKEAAGTPPIGQRALMIGCRRRLSRGHQGRHELAHKPALASHQCRTRSGNEQVPMHKPRQPSAEMKADSDWLWFLKALFIQEVGCQWLSIWQSRYPKDPPLQKWRHLTGSELWRWFS